MSGKVGRVQWFKEGRGKKRKEDFLEVGHSGVRGENSREKLGRKRKKEKREKRKRKSKSS